ACRPTSRSLSAVVAGCFAIGWARERLRRPLSARGYRFKGGGLPMQTNGADYRSLPVRPSLSAIRTLRKPAVQARVAIGAAICLQLHRTRSTLGREGHVELSPSTTAGVYRARERQMVANRPSDSPPD